MVATLEDVIVAKLEWAEQGASARQLEDVRALIELAVGRLDVRYIDAQSAALGLDAAWQRPRPTGP